jgi:hypothetical protein
LSELDTNHDGVIDSQDAAFADLRVWVDANSDGITESGELKTLTDLQISQLSLSINTEATFNNGNLVGLNSSYQTTDGATHAAADVWFQVDLRSNVTNLTQAMAEFSSGEPAAAAVSLTSGVKTPDVTQPVLAVASLVDAMKQFDGPYGQMTADLARSQITRSAATELLTKDKALSGLGFLASPN